MIRHQFGQVEFASEHWFRLAATTLASLTRAAGLATPAKPTPAHLRRLDLVAISDRLASLILVLREGSLKQVLVTLDEPTDAGRPVGRGGRPQRPARRPHRRRTRSARSRASTPPTRRSRSHRRVGERVVARPPASSTRAADRGAVQRRPAQRDGRARVRPEREAPPRVRGAREPRLPRRAHQRRRRRAAGPRLHRHARTRPRRWPTSRSSSPRTGDPGRAVGVVGVLGPTRMAYPQAIGTVRFVSGLMNELIDHLYA